MEGTVFLNQKYNNYERCGIFIIRQLKIMI